VEQFRSRPLDARPYRFVQADALTLLVREGDRTVLVHGTLSQVRPVQPDGRKRSRIAAADQYGEG
jgi:transposase-like protein